MVRKRIQRIVAALATVGGLLGLGSAQAAVYTAVWDPPYGAPYSQMGWQGQASINVPAGCLIAGSGDVIVDSETGCDGLGSFATVTAASVDLFTLTPSFASTAGPTNTLTFIPSTLPIQKLRFVDGVLVGLQTDVSDGVVDNLVARPGFGVSFYLEFVLDFFGDPVEESAFASTSSVSGFDNFSGPLLRFSDGFCECSGANSPDFLPTLTITLVPEPGSLALAALGLAGLGWRGAQRRRQERQG